MFVLEGKQLYLFQFNIKPACKKNHYELISTSSEKSYSSLETDDFKSSLFFNNPPSPGSNLKSNFRNCNSCAIFYNMYLTIRVYTSKQCHLHQFLREDLKCL